MTDQASMDSESYTNIIDKYYSTKILVTEDFSNKHLTEWMAVVRLMKHKHTLITMPVGRCFSTTQLLVLLTAWPPGPCPRTFISSKSLSSKGGYSKSSECFNRTQCMRKLPDCPVEGKCCNGTIFTFLAVEQICNEISRMHW